MVFPVRLIRGAERYTCLQYGPELSVPDKGAKRKGYRRSPRSTFLYFGNKIFLNSTTLHSPPRLSRPHDRLSNTSRDQFHFHLSFLPFQFHNPP